MTDSNKPAASCLAVAETRLDDVPSDVREAVAKDIADVSALLGGYYTAQCPNVPATVGFWLTSDFNAAVRAIVAEHGGKTDSSYEAQRITHRAMGKLLVDPNADQLTACIVLDAALWQTNEPHARYQRSAIALHELCHLLRRAEDIRDGVSSPPEPDPDPFRTMFVRLGRYVWEEFEVDTICESLLRAVKFATDKDWNAVHGLDTYAAGYEDGPTTLLTWFCDWVNWRVWAYRESGDDRMLGDIWEEAAPRIEEMFTALAHALAAHVSAGRLEELGAKLAESPGFAAFLADDWERFTGAFELVKEEAAQELRDVAFGLMDRLGFRPEGMPGGGFYLHVREPGSCA